MCVKVYTWHELWSWWLVSGGIYIEESKFSPTSLESMTFLFERYVYIWCIIKHLSLIRIIDIITCIMSNSFLVGLHPSLLKILLVCNNIHILWKCIKCFLHITNNHIAKKNNKRQLESWNATRYKQKGMSSKVLPSFSLKSKP